MKIFLNRKAYQHTVIFSVVLALLSCNNSQNKKRENRNSKPDPNIVDTSNIEGMITLHEYLKRESRNHSGIYTDEQLQKLKDSINYDSIMKNRELPVFK